MGRILIGNIKGPQGEAGKNFEYAKTYASVSAMNADFSGTDVAEGEYVVISAGIDDADNGRVYRKGTNSYVYVNRVNGPTGPRGATGPMPTLVNNLNTTTAGQGALDAAVGPTIDGKVTGNGGEAGDTIATFTTSDTTTASEIIEYTDMDKLTSGSPLKTLMSIMSKAVKNVRWFQKLLGTTDISGIGNGTVTNAVSTLNDAKASNRTVLLYNSGIAASSQYTLSQSIAEFRYILLQFVVTKGVSSDSVFEFYEQVVVSAHNTEAQILFAASRDSGIGVSGSLYLNGTSMYVNTITKASGISSRNIWLNVYGVDA